MAREIVITSVPRGVKLGRTGFQVAMQSAGMRDDVATALEKMAGYRHLPTGTGANPVSYFHRIAKSVAGQSNVIGRIVDSGVDFSNRSNKLAHMVVLDSGDLGAVGGASPAATLAAIENRLASTWTGGPEERQTPFSLAGIQAETPAICALWKSTMGDAGWAGVLAERAVRNEPTLIVGGDSSPASCRKMLDLFIESMALIPPSKRWSITFDTVTLAPEGILWRGTYAGSPESQAVQPGVLVVDLVRAKPVPNSYDGFDLVQAARAGRTDSGPSTRSVALNAPSRSRSAPSDAVATAGTLGGHGPSLPSPPPPPRRRGRKSSVDDMEWEDVPLTGGGKSFGWWPFLAAAALLVLIGGAGVGGYVASIEWQRTKSQQRISDYAQNRDNAEEPSLNDYRRFLGREVKSVRPVTDEKLIAFLNQSLRNGKRTNKVLSRDELQLLVDHVQSVMTQSNEATRDARSNVLGLDKQIDPELDNVITSWYPKGFGTYEDLYEATKSCEWILNVSKQPADKRAYDEAFSPLWRELVSPDVFKDCSAEDLIGIRDRFLASLQPGDCASIATLRDKAKNAIPEPAGNLGSSLAPTPGDDTELPSEKECLESLRTELRKVRKSRNGTWPPDITPRDLFRLDPEIAEVLVSKKILKLAVGKPVSVAGPAADLSELKVTSTGTGCWSVCAGDDTLIIVDIDKGAFRVRRGDASEEVWKKHEQTCRFMPLAFYANDRPSDNDYVILSPTLGERAVQCSGGGCTLYDLLCDDIGQTVISNADIIDWRLVADLPVRSTLSLEKGSPIELTFQRRTSEEYLLAVIDCESKAALTQDLVCKRGGEALTITRPGPSWADRASRLGFLGTLKQEIHERNVVGLGEKKRVPNPQDNIPLIFQAIVESRTVPRDSFVKNYLLEWCNWNELGVKGDPKRPKEWDKLDRANELSWWRDMCRSYVRDNKDGAFIRSRVTKFKETRPEPKKPDGPEAFIAPKRKEGMTDEEYKKRRTDLESDHDNKWREYREWAKELQKKLDSDLHDREVLAEYFSIWQAGANKGDPGAEIAAIRVLADMDGFIVAKKYRSEITAALKRIPVVACFAGDVSYEFDLQGRRVLVPVCGLQRSELSKSKVDAIPTSPDVEGQ